MKIAVVGANGNLGSRVVKQALTRGHEVKSIVYHGKHAHERVEKLTKSLFDITEHDLNGYDVLISAFGGGFHADPVINKQAYLKYIELLESCDIKLIAIGGAGSLHVDERRSQYEFELSSYPPVLREMSRNIRLGIDEISKVDKNWTIVCPSSKFDPEGPFTKDYIISNQGVIIFNEDQESYVTYDDLAYAILDIAESDAYKQEVVTIATRTTK